MADAVNDVEWNLLDLLTVKHDKVILADKEVVLCDEHQTLFLIVPMIDPTQEKGKSIKNMGITCKDAQYKNSGQCQSQSLLWAVLFCIEKTELL